jgi:hypothetical protein
MQGNKSMSTQTYGGWERKWQTRKTLARGVYNVHPYTQMEKNLMELQETLKEQAWLAVNKHPN